MWSERGVILVGVAAGIAIAVLPEGAVPLVALAAALIAGALLPLRPMVASVLVLVPTIIVAVVRTAIDSDRNVGAMLLSLLSAVFVAAILTHVSAGVVLRRNESDASL
jgi:hypothetical protein